MRLRDVVELDYRRFSELARRPAARLTFIAMFHPRIFPVVLIRVASSLHTWGWPRAGALVSLLNQALFRVEVPARAQIGPGLVLPHPNGIVIGSAIIEENVTIFQNVTLGARKFDAEYDASIRPILRAGCIVGAGGVVLGPVVVGRDATVAANSLVLADVPAGCTAIGVPAAVKDLRSPAP